MKEIDFRHDLLPLKDQLYRLALRITLDTAEAEDVVEDTLIRVWERRDGLGQIRSLEALCSTICRNLALDRKARMQSNNLSLDEGDYDAIDGAAIPDEQLEHQERAQQVQQIFNSLPERMRTALHLREVEEKSYREVAEIMGLTEENVKVIIHRARQQIKKQYEALQKYGL